MVINISELQPINRDYGVYEGTPIARYYIDKYFDNIAEKVHGKVLEFGWPTYAANMKCEYEIIDIDKNNSLATTYMDICDESICQVKPDYYDFIICTAVLQLVPDPKKAVVNMYNMLRSGGVLILAEKNFSKIDPWAESIDKWRFTQYGLRYLLEKFSTVNINTYGNVFVTCAYLVGTPVEKIEKEKLEYADPEYPLVSIAYAEK